MSYRHVCSKCNEHILTVMVELKPRASNRKVKLHQACYAALKASKELDAFVESRCPPRPVRSQEKGGKQP